MGIITSEKSYIEFGKEINKNKTNIRGEVDVITKEVLEATYPMNLIIKCKNGQVLQKNLRFHFCEDLHKEISNQNYDKTKYSKDERIFFVD